MSLAGDRLPPILERHGRRSQPAIFNQDGFCRHPAAKQEHRRGVGVGDEQHNTLIGGGPVANPGTTWHAIGTGDDGADILLQNTSGQASVWEMSGNTIVGGGPADPSPGPNWRASELTYSASCCWSPASSSFRFLVMAGLTRPSTRTPNHAIKPMISWLNRRWLAMALAPPGWPGQARP
jgi:hypothetical protein